MWQVARLYICVRHDQTRAVPLLGGTPLIKVCVDANAAAHANNNLCKHT